MMKLYQFQLLLFLLLISVNTTLSISPGVLKKIEKVIGHPATEDTLKKVLEQIIPSPPSPQLSKEIPGLYLIKQYLSDFGYLQQSGPFNNVSDQETRSAIKSYQQYFNLQATGNANLLLRIFLQQIALPRCGVPDMNFKYDLTDNISFPKGNQWFPNGTKYLTYGFAPENEIPLNKTNVFRKAFTRWSQTTRVLNFTESKSYDDADIKIGFYNITYDVFDVVVVDTVIKLDSNVKSGFILLDDSKQWVLPTQEGEFDLESVAMHQIGHLLGLDHSSDNKSIMYPIILPSQQRRVQITDSDNLAIQQLYFSDIKANANSHYSSGFFTSLSIGFAFVALLNV